MKDKIKAALKTKYSNRGFSDKVIDGLAEKLAKTVTTDEEIETAVSGVETDLNIFQSEIDSRVNAAIKKAKEEKGADPEPTNPQGGNSNPTEQAPAWAKAIIDANAAMQQELATLKGENTQKTRAQQLTEKLKDAPDAIKNKIVKDFSRMAFQTDEDFNAYLSETESDVTTAVQELTNRGLGQFPKPAFPNTPGGGNNEESIIKSWAKEKVELNK